MDNATHNSNHDPAANRHPVALITGASRGLGAVLARFLAQQDYDLIVSARGAAELAAVAESLRQFGGHVVDVTGDMADPAHREKLVQAAGGLGRLDLLVNNASTLGPSPLPKLADYPLDALREVLEVNLVAPLGLIQSALPLLSASGGRVVNISSDAGVEGYPGWGGYGSSKAALDLLTRTFAAELGDTGVAVLSVDPGDMRTAMHQAAYPGEDISDRPLPEVTLPFWAWLLGQDGRSVAGGRFQAQAERWLVPG
jgi:NAD(P)-dependent dehydrogenase (short-subunit alcohol dehydrogenase family)